MDVYINYNPLPSVEEVTQACGRQVAACAQRVNPRFCRIFVLAPAAGSATDMLTVAHEVAHCLFGPFHEEH